MDETHAQCEREQINGDVPAVTVFNLGVGAVSIIPAENISSSIDTNMEAVLFKILIFGANTLVIGLLVGKSMY